MSEQRNLSRITVLVNNPDGWVQPMARQFVQGLTATFQATYVEKTAEVPEGDAAFFLGCSRIVPPEILARNRLNLVVHGSDLPKGRGFSPIPWQVLEGRNSIPLVLFEAREDLDSGPIYLRDTLELDGTELIDEIHRKTWRKIETMITQFLEHDGRLEAVPQAGEPTAYRRRTGKDDEIDPLKTIAEQFDQLRIVDNERYPAWFTLRGQRYKLKIIKDDP